jgi:nucleotide-binding universal stress UspA family protein
MSSFERVICGVDGSAEGLEALRQAMRLLAPGGRLLSLTVFDPSIAAQAGWEATKMLADLRQGAEQTVRDAERQLEGVAGAEARVLEGFPASRLERAARDEQATLVAVGSHGHSRAVGILLGGVATTLLHEAPCNVLVARPTAAGSFPSSLVVGVDGSPQSRAAVAVGHELAERFSASLHLVTAAGGKAVDVDGLATGENLQQWSERAPVDALLAASAEADLLIVGSRGLHGLAALGSVSERVAHRAGCSVLVVRPQE